MLRLSRARLHGMLHISVGDSVVPVDGSRVSPMIPSNHIYHDPARLRATLDADGFVYLKNLVPRDAMRAAYGDVCQQLEANRWWSDDVERGYGFVFGIACPRPDPVTGAPGPLPAPAQPFHITDRVQRACFGSSVLAAVRQVFGGGAECMNYNSLDLAATGERQGFHMPSVYMNRGTKLVLTAWVAMHDMPFNVGGIVCCRGSNRAPELARVRETYGSHDVEDGGIRGDGTLTMCATDAWNLSDGACPLAVSSFEPGDVVLSTVYTMQSFSTNQSGQWRVSAQSRWVMHGDDVGVDPRFGLNVSEDGSYGGGAGAASAGPQLSNWLRHRDDPLRYPRTMEQARAAWGIAPR